MIPRRLTLALVIVVQGCVLAPIELEGRPCPCANGWFCDEARNRCVQERPAIDAGPDARVELDAAMELDAPGLDAFAEDPNTACDDLLASALFCESFEDGSMIHWTVREARDGTVNHSSTDAFRGKGLLRAASTAGGGYGERIATVVGGIEEGEVHVRAYLYIPSGMPLVHSNLIHIGGHRTRAATEPPAGFNVVDGHAAMYIGAGNVSLRDRRVMLPRDRWFCMQYMLLVDDVAGIARVWIDGALAGEAIGIDTRAPEPYVSLGAGIGWSELEQLPFEVRIDELAIGRTMLPCE